MKFWDVLDGSEEPPPSNANPNVLEYQRCVKKAMSIIKINMTNN